MFFTFYKSLSIVRFEWFVKIFSSLPLEIYGGKRGICGASGHAQDYDCLLSTNATQTRPKRSPTLVGHSHLLSKVEHPTFDYTVPTNITTQLGQTVYLHCKVHNLEIKS
ncbi:uncharacterized protein CEXT_10531 [Caerostris extrusa]|uniref:Uncharacterized protein n=1 Tax=Caerostris extrusa TaxID=172846 RepID=A0AAV4UY93_CAEEX|nr:uncharacterized protein CEXT_10531 [Caerostris extrusa]